MLWPIPTALIVGWPFLWLRRYCRLDIVLVEVQSGIQFGLFDQQFSQPRFVFEGLCQFTSKSREVRFELLKLFPLAFCGSFEGSQGVLDALDGAYRIRRVQTGGVGAAAAQEERRHGIGFQKGRPLALAHNVKASEVRADLARFIVFPGEDEVRQGLGRFFARTLAGEGPIAHGHRKRFGIVAIA